MFSKAIYLSLFCSCVAISLAFPVTFDHRTKAPVVRTSLSWLHSAPLEHIDDDDSRGDEEDLPNSAIPIESAESSWDSASSPSTSFATTSGIRRNMLLTAAGTITSSVIGRWIVPHSNDDDSGAAWALYDDEMKRISVFEKTAPSVVFLDTFVERRDAFTTNVLEVPLGSGSGFVWDKEGHIVTNYHVVRNAQTAQVAILSSSDDSSTLPSTLGKKEKLVPMGSSSSSFDGDDILPYTSMRPMSSPFGNGGTVQRSVFKARVVGIDPGKDIAVLKVDAPKDILQPIAVGTSKGLRVGQQALAIGNPFGLDHTLTTGIVSGIGREVKSPTGRPITNVIQTDAPINPGNSGGPLLDSDGYLIGMNTAIFSPTGASAGIGFAIPVDTIKYIVDTLIRDGAIIRPVIGISFLDSKQARTLGITTGVLVLDVPDGSPAAIAGLKGTRRTESGLIEIGDIITKVGDTVINREADLFAALEDLQPGDVVKVTVNRLAAVQDELKIKELTFSVKLQSSADVERKNPQFRFDPNR